MLIIVTIIVTFSMSVYATEPGDNARTVENPDETNSNSSEVSGEETVPTDDGEGTDDDGHNHDTIDPESIHQGDRYIASQESIYEMNELINGNLFIVGKNIKFSGQVNGSVFVFAQEFTMTEDAYIGGQLFLAAGNATISGIIVDMYSATQDLKIDEKTMFYRNVNAVSENISLSGMIGRDVNLIAKSITVPETETPLTIYGNLEYQASNKLEGIEEKASITGEVKYTHYKEKEKDIADIIWESVISAIGTVIFDVIMYLVLLFLAPKFVEKAKDYVSSKGALSLAFGLAFVVVIPVISLILLMLGVTAGASLTLLLVYFTVLMINAFIVSLVANEYIANKLKMGDDKLKKGL